MADPHLVVVGGGPAGSTAAITAVRAGLDVTLIDKAAFPRDKTCGDGLTALALGELGRLGLDPGSLPSWTPVSDVALRSPSGRVVSLDLAPEHRPAVPTVVVRRAELDNALIDMAAETGVRVRTGSAVTGVRPGVNAITVELADGRRISADHVVAADGMWSPTRRLLGLDTPGYRGEWHAARAYLPTDSPAADRMWVWFEPDLLPGYAWSFPVGEGHVNFGFGVVRHQGLRGAEFAATWRDLMNRPHIQSVVGGGHGDTAMKAWPIPARVTRAPLTGPRTLFVGDAAAATDPMTGEGIGQAMETGRLAAEALAAGRVLGPAAVAGHYRRSVRRTLLADHRLAAGLSRLMTSSLVTRAALAAVDTNDWTRRNFARWMFEDYPRAVLATPRRWRSLRSGRPGTTGPR